MQRILSDEEFDEASDGEDESETMHPGVLTDSVEAHPPPVTTSSVISQSLLDEPRSDDLSSQQPPRQHNLFIEADDLLVDSSTDKGASPSSKVKRGYLNTIPTPTSKGTSSNNQINDLFAKSTSSQNEVHLNSIPSPTKDGSREVGNAGGLIATSMASHFHDAMDIYNVFDSDAQIDNTETSTVDEAHQDNAASQAQTSILKYRDWLINDGFGEEAIIIGEKKPGVLKSEKLALVRALTLLCLYRLQYFFILINMFDTICNIPTTVEPRA